MLVRIKSSGMWSWLGVRRPSQLLWASEAAIRNCVSWTIAASNEEQGGRLGSLRNVQNALWATAPLGETLRLRSSKTPSRASRALPQRQTAHYGALLLPCSRKHTRTAASETHGISGR